MTLLPRGFVFSASLAVAMATLILGCGGAPTPAASDSASHAHDHHGTLVHRFDNAERWAKEFDDPARDVWQQPSSIVEAMKLEPGMTVADIGAGTGYFEPWLSRAVGAGGAVLALDVESDMVRYLVDRTEREHLGNVHAALVPHDDPKLAAASVNRILIVDTWHHIPARAAYATKVREALKPTGQVFVVDFKLDAKHGPPPAHRLPPERTAQELTAGGLRVEVLAIDLPEQYVVVGTRPR